MVTKTVPLEVLMEIRDCVYEARSDTKDNHIWSVLNRANALIVTYLIPKIDVKLEVKEDTTAEHENYINRMRENAHENT